MEKQKRLLEAFAELDEMRQNAILTFTLQQHEKYAPKRPRLQVIVGGRSDDSALRQPRFGKV
jgi:hypothetical protein